MTNAARHEMDAAIKSHVVPELRAMGFQGSFPHFYRKIDDHVDLLTFQFASAGGRFVVEISFADARRTNIYIPSCRDLPRGKLRVSMTVAQHRLGSNPEEENADHWFSFAPRGLLFKRPPCEQIAKSIVPLLRDQGEAWWSSKRKHC